MRDLIVHRRLWDIGLLVLVGGSALLLLYAAQGVLAHPFNNTSDATIYAEVGFKLNDPALYVHDPVIMSQTRDFFTLVFYTLLPDAWESLDHVGTTYVTLGVLFGLIFGVGAYLLVDQVFQRRDVA